MVNLAFEDYIYCNPGTKNEYRIFIDSADQKNYYNEKSEDKKFKDYSFLDNPLEHTQTSDHSTSISDEDKNNNETKPPDSPKKVEFKSKLSEKAPTKQIKRRRRRRTIPQNPHSMMTRAYSRYVNELLLSNDLPSNYLEYFDTQMPLGEGDQEYDNHKASLMTIEELIEEVILPDDLIYYFDIYKVELFDIKKNRRNSKHLSHVVLTLPFEMVLGKKMTTKYVYSSIYSAHSTLPVIESIHSKFNSIRNTLNNPPANAIFSAIIKNLVNLLGDTTISGPIDPDCISYCNLIDNNDKLNALISKKKLLKSWNANAIMSKCSKQPKLMPLGQWASFFCGDYKDKTCTDPDYVDGLYLVNIDDIPIKLDKFEEQFNWEVDLLWERNEISLEERDGWYRLAGLDEDSLHSRIKEKKRYEENKTFYGNLIDDFNTLDDHVIDKFNIINPPKNYSPVACLEPKIKYSRSYIYKEANTKYYSKTDPYFAFKLSYRFPHEFINPL